MALRYNITKGQAQRLYKTMKDLNDILLKNGIAYWVTGGSLIGALRHRGIVPWDDDGDICIMRKDVNKLRKLVPLFERKNYILEEGTADEDDGSPEPCVNKKNSCTWFLEPKGKNSLGVDIFVMDRIGPLVTYADPSWRNAPNGGRTCYFLHRYIFPLIPVRFGNFWVMTPYNAIEHLNQCYGTDWNSVSQRLYDHREGKWINSKKIRMGVEDYQTIPAPRSTCTPTPPSVKSCTLGSRSSSNLKDMSDREVRLVARLFKIKGRSKMSIPDLKKKIAKIK